MSRQTTERSLDALATAIAAPYGPVDTSVAIEAQRIVYALADEDVLEALGDASQTNAIEAREHIAAMCRLFAELQEELEAERTKVSALRASLHKYGWHLPGCYRETAHADSTCDCGWDAAMTAAETEAKP